MSNYFNVNTSAISSIIFSPKIYFSKVLLLRILNSDRDGEKEKMKDAAPPVSQLMKTIIGH